MNPRYIWLGDQSHDDAMQLLSGARLLVLSSLMEGGASVIAEAVVCGVPVLCSRIAGNIGMLGRDHLGYFKPRDSGELRERLETLENEPQSWERLHRHVLALGQRFSPDAERDAWNRLLHEL